VADFFGPPCIIGPANLCNDNEKWFKYVRITNQPDTKSNPILTLPLNSTQ